MTLEIKNLSIKHANTLLLDNIHLCIKQGQTTALLGKSGSGKTISTTFLQNLVPENVEILSGDILLDSKKILSSKGYIASIMQNPKTCFNPLHTIKSHIQESSNASKEEILSILQEVGLESYILRYYPFMLSGGMLQRVMIAISLLSKAPFLVADEPTTDLDVIISRKILTLLKRLQRNRNIGILFITHDLDIALHMADSIAFIEGGKILECVEKKDIANTKMLSRLGEILQQKILDKQCY